MKITDITPIKAKDLVTVSDYVKYLKEKTNRETITTATIFYQLNNTDNLDWCEVSGVIFIVKNKKYKTFEPGTNYGKGKNVRVDTF